MEFLSIQDAMAQGSGDVNLRGWVYRERGSSKIRFIVLRDASNIIQCVFKKDAVSEEQWEVLSGLQVEACIQITGEIKPDERAPTGFELVGKSVTLVGASDTYPITKDQSTEFLLEKRHLWIRSRRMVALMKIRSTVLGAIHDYYRSNGYYEFSAPILSPNACEGGSTLFNVEYYDRKMYLTQSWQLYAEAGVFGLEKIYFTGPCFRAEKSKTSRHLSEFWMSEMEGAWMDLGDICNIAEELIEHVVQTVLKKHPEELKLLERDTSKLENIKAPFPRLKYDEVLKILKEKKDMDVPWGKDLRTIEEDKLMELYDKPVIITHYPKETMAFYKPKDPESPKHALCVDIIAPEGYGEIVGGSQRDTDVESLIAGLKEEGENIENYSWYLDLRKYGSVPHSGFGMGVERVIAWICGLDNIKDAIPFPRTMIWSKP